VIVAKKPQIVWFFRFSKNCTGLNLKKKLMFYKTIYIGCVFLITLLKDWAMKKYPNWRYAYWVYIPLLLLILLFNYRSIYDDSMQNNEKNMVTMHYQQLSLKYLKRNTKSKLTAKPVLYLEANSISKDTSDRIRVTLEICNKGYASAEGVQFRFVLPNNYKPIVEPVGEITRLNITDEWISYKYDLTGVIIYSRTNNMPYICKLPVILTFDNPSCKVISISYLIESKSKNFSNNLIVKNPYY
jgi:hypothetical protein